MKYKLYVISLSMGNYIHGTGGTGNVISEHQRIYNENGISYVHISPYSKYFRGKKIKLDLYSLVIDGIDRGVFTLNEIFDLLYKSEQDGCILNRIFIHHLKEFDMDVVETICDSWDCPIVFYIHDYYTVCVSHTLINSQGVFCGEERCSKEKCGECSYYNSMIKRQDIFKKLFKKYRKRIIPVAPSKCALRIWENDYTSFKNVSRAIPHQSLLKFEKPANYANKRIRIGYVGAQIKYKGWDEWKKIVFFSQELGLPYDFYYFGDYKEEQTNVKHVSVTVSAKNPTAMTDALIKEKIDCVFLLSLWPETYSYTCFESWMAGAVVIAYKNSGNIADVIKNDKVGAIVENTEELCDLLKDEPKFRNLLAEIKGNYLKIAALDINRKDILSLVNQSGCQMIKQKYTKNSGRNLFQSVVSGMYKAKYGIKDEWQ